MDCFAISEDILHPPLDKNILTITDIQSHHCHYNKPDLILTRTKAAKHVSMYVCTYMSFISCNRHFKVTGGPEVHCEGVQLI